MEARLAARGVSPSVLYHCRRVLSVVVNYALKLDLIRHNPLRGLDAVVYERQEPATPDVESVSKLLDHVRSRNADYYALFRLVAYTGMRIGEVLALRWTEVDFDGRYLRVLYNLGLGLDGRFEVNSPKSRAGRRRVDLGTAEVLLEHRDRQQGDMESADEVWEGLNLVFPNRVGGYRTSGTVLEALGRYGAAVGLEGLTTRALRHFHASVALQTGHNVVTVSQRLGHSRVSIMSDIYAHALPGWQREVADGFASLMDG